MSTKPIGINADAGAPEYAAVDWRRSQVMLLTHGVADGLGARAGIRPGGSDAFSLSGQTVNVNARPVTVYPGESATDGPYIGHLMPDTHTLDPADGSNPRIDIVIVRVYDDDHDASGRRELVTEYIPGSPNASPVPPATPSGAWAALQILVPAGGSPAPSATYTAPFTVAAGGVLPVRSSAELPTSGLYDGFTVWDQSRRMLVGRDDGAWRPLGGLVTIDHGEATGDFTIDVPAGEFRAVRLWMVGSLNGTGRVFTRVNNDSTASLHRRSWHLRTMATDALADSASGDTGTQYYTGRWANITTSSAHTMDAWYGDTHVASRVPMTADSRRQGGTGAGAQKLTAQGDLSADRLLTSLRVLALDSDFVSARWILQGVPA